MRSGSRPRTPSPRPPSPVRQLPCAKSSSSLNSSLRSFSSKPDAKQIRPSTAGTLAIVGSAVGLAVIADQVWVVEPESISIMSVSGSPARRIMLPASAPLFCGLACRGPPESDGNPTVWLAHVDGSIRCVFADGRGQVARSVRAHSRRVSALVATPTGIIVSADDGGRLIFWSSSSASPSPIGQIKVSHGVTSLAAGAGRILVSLSTGACVLVAYDTENGFVAASSLIDIGSPRVESVAYVNDCWVLHSAGQLLFGSAAANGWTIDGSLHLPARVAAIIPGSEADTVVGASATGDLVVVDVVRRNLVHYSHPGRGPMLLAPVPVRTVREIMVVDEGRLHTVPINGSAAAPAQSSPVHIPATATQVHEQLARQCGIAMRSQFSSLLQQIDDLIADAAETAKDPRTIAALDRAHAKIFTALAGFHDDEQRARLRKN